MVGRKDLDLRDVRKHCPTGYNPGALDLLPAAPFHAGSVAAFLWVATRGIYGRLFGGVESLYSNALNLASAAGVTVTNLATLCCSQAQKLNSYRFPTNLP